MSSPIYKFQVPLPSKYENLYCLIGYDPRSWYYIKEENPNFGEVVGALLAEEYEKAESLNDFRIKTQRKLYNARAAILNKLSPLLLGIRCITAVTPHRDIISAIYLDLKPLKTFTWPRRCPREILFYSIIKEKAYVDNCLTEYRRTTSRVISKSFNWLYEPAPFTIDYLASDSESDPGKFKRSRASSSNRSSSIQSPKSPSPISDGEDADDEL